MNTKYWSLTWDRNSFQPHQEKCIYFLNRALDSIQLQYERGEKTTKTHI